MDFAAIFGLISTLASHPVLFSEELGFNSGLVGFVMLVLFAGMISGISTIIGANIWAQNLN